MKRRQACLSGRGGVGQQGQAPFLVWAHRRISEDDTGFVKVLTGAVRSDYDYASEWSRQGKVWDPLVKSMWNACRPTILAATNRSRFPQEETAAQSGDNRQGGDD